MTILTKSMEAYAVHKNMLEFSATADLATVVSYSCKLLKTVAIRVIVVTTYSCKI
jgi:hypothetical protein